LYLKNETNFFTTEKKVLHFAPEQCFLKRFKKLKHIDYTTTDLESPIADIKADICNLPFEDNSYDVILCNHVLEHVESDIKAMKEVFRVLKSGGWAILQVPINYDYKETHEDLTITDPKERERIFGQYDHVRWHGTDYGKRLASAGFDVDENAYIDSFSDEDIEKYRLPKGEIVYIAKKA
jgi:SAM-dependent methyltransferase